MKNSILFTALLCFVFTSCKDKDDSGNGNVTPSKSRTEMLTAHEWKLGASTVNPPINFFGVQISDFYAILPACSKDDFRKYNTGGTYIMDEGATKCDPADPQTDNGTWKFIANDTKFVEDEDTLNITSFTANEIKLEFTEVDSGTTYTFRTTLIKK